MNLEGGEGMRDPRNSIKDQDLHPDDLSRCLAGIEGLDGYLKAVRAGQASIQEQLTRDRERCESNFARITEELRNLRSTVENFGNPLEGVDKILGSLERVTRVAYMRGHDSVLSEIEAPDKPVPVMARELETVDESPPSAEPKSWLSRRLRRSGRIWTVAAAVVVLVMVTAASVLSATPPVERDDRPPPVLPSAEPANREEPAPQQALPAPSPETSKEGRVRGRPTDGDNEGEYQPLGLLGLAVSREGASRQDGQRKRQADDADATPLRSEGPLRQIVKGLLGGKP